MFRPSQKNILNISEVLKNLAVHIKGLKLCFKNSLNNNCSSN